jgi:hypothetical protein
MSQFSKTRAADQAAAATANAVISQAVAKLHASGTSAGRGSILEAFELLQWMVNNGFAISYNSTSITQVQIGS